MFSTTSGSGWFTLRSVTVTAILGFILILFIAHFTGWYENPALNLIFTRHAEKIALADVTDTAGLGSFRRPPVNTENPAYLEVMGGGVAVGDIDGDGWEDLFFTGMPPFGSGPGKSPSPTVLYRNRGDGTYKDITAEAGLDQISGYPTGALFFDYNNDGRQDLYVAAYDGGELFRNEGGFFINATTSAGLSLEGFCGDYPCMAVAASSADYNRDGYLDLLIVNNVNWDINNPNYYGQGTLVPIHYTAQPSVLFKNDGDGTFTDVSEESGVTNRDTRGYREDGKGLSAVWSDFNNDRWPDIYIANDLSPNRLYINRGNGTFSEIGIAAYVDESKSSMGVDAVDFNHSGNIDLVTTNLIGVMTSLFRNHGDLRFDYVTYHTGIMPSARSSGWGIAFTDLNLDGYPDLVMGSGPLWQRDYKDEAKNLIFKNLGTGKFEDVTDRVIHFSNEAMTRGLAVTDFDRSGTPDLVFSNIDGKPSQLVKNLTSGNNWIRVDLEGTVSNRDAVGARVTLKRKDGLVQSQTVVAGNSYISSGSKSLFFGLGNSSVEELVVQWPSGKTDTLINPDINTILHVRERNKP